MKSSTFKYLAAALLLTAAFRGGAEQPKIRLTAEPREFPAGDWTRISITAERELERGDLKLPEIPGARWHTENAGTSRRISIVNGRSERSYTYTLPLSATKPGELVIPSFEVRFADGETARSEPLKLRVLAAGEAPKGGGAAVGRIVVPAERRGFYVGEEIPVEFELSVPAGLRLRDLEFPRMNCDGPAVPPDLSRQRTRHPHFYDPREGVRNTPEGPVRVLTFRTALRFMRPGEFTLSATEALSVVAPSDGRARSGRFGFGFDDMDADDFFADPFGGARTRRTVVSYPEIKLAVAPLPEPPAGSHVLELFGDWRVTPMLSARSARVGEPVELELKLEGAGSLAGFRPPKLEFPDFRVYPPELKDDPDGARSIRYALIPLRPGEYKLDPVFALFDVATGSYRTIRRELELAVSGTAIAAAPQAAPRVTPPPRPGSPAATPAATAGAAGPAPAAEAAPEITFIPGEKIELPLTRRGLLRGAAAFTALALAALGIEIALRRRERRHADVAGEERRRHTRELIRRVGQGENVNDILRSGGMAALALVLGLPEDSTGSEIAQRVADPDLREVLVSSERDAFAPESARRHGVLTPKAKKELLKLLKRSLSLAAALFVFTAGAAESEADPATWVRRACAGGVWDAVGCRNAGVAFRRAGDLPRARLHLERAHLLAPRDERIAAELERVVELLGETAEKPALPWRDFFRPDEYLATAGALFGLVLLTAALLRRRYRRTAFAVGWTCAAAGVLAAALAWSQYSSSGSYRGSRAVVTAPGVELSALPVATGGADAGRLNGGSAADVVEERGGFIRLRGAGASGWCPRGAAERIFPAKTAPGY